MKTIAIKHMVSIAKKLALENKPWHFHVLDPGCRFNDSKQFRFILENSTDRTTYGCFAKNRNLKASKMMLKFLYRNHSKTKNTARSASFDKLKSVASHFNKDRVPWHNHVFFPRCIYNTAKGKWTLVVESNGKLLEASYKARPQKFIDQLEALHYAQKF